MSSSHTSTHISASSAPSAPCDVTSLAPVNRSVNNEPCCSGENSTTAPPPATTDVDAVRPRLASLSSPRLRGLRPTPNGGTGSSHSTAYGSMRPIRSWPPPPLTSALNTCTCNKPRGGDCLEPPRPSMALAEAGVAAAPRGWRVVSSASASATACSSAADCWRVTGLAAMRELGGAICEGGAVSRCPAACTAVAQLCASRSASSTSTWLA